MPAMDRSTYLSDLLSQLYASVATPRHWPIVLQRIADLLHCEHGVLLSRASWQGPLLLWSSAGLQRSDQDRFCSPHCAEIGRPLFQAAPTGIACPRNDFISDRRFERSDFYNDIIRPVKGFRSLNAVLGASGSHATLIGFCRPRTAPDFDAEETASLQELLPHFSTALELAIRLRAVEEPTRSLRALFDALDSGVVLLDGAGQPQFINRRAAMLLAEKDGLALKPSGLVTASVAKTDALRSAIATVAAKEGHGLYGTGGRQMSVPRLSLRAPLLLSILPLARCDDIACSSARAAIFITESDAQHWIDPELIAEHFGLTNREAAVAIRIAAGLDSRAVALALDIGIGTVRTHLKHVFGKTATKSQTALALKLRAFVSPGFVPPGGR
jgi:DNA-binding CsgD family transcriptional regulator